MHRILFFLAAAAAVCSACVVAGAGEQPARSGPPPLGPWVVVTLLSGESNRGQLLGFADGQLQLKTEAGELLTRDGSQVLMLRFAAHPGPPHKAGEVPGGKPPTLPSAQETQLSLSEFKTLRDYRASDRKTGTLSKLDEDDFVKLRSKLELHIEALNREIRAVDNEENATGALADLIHCYLMVGTIPQDMKIMVTRAADNISKETVRKNVQAKMPLLLASVEERFRKFKKSQLPPPAQ